MADSRPRRSPPPQAVRWKRRALYASGGLALALLGLPTQLAPQPADMTRTALPGHGPVASVSIWSVAPGGQVTVRGHGFRSGTRVDVTCLASARHMGVVVNADGTGAVVVLLAVPAEAPPGWRAVVLSGTGATGRTLTEQVGVDVVR